MRHAQAETALDVLDELRKRGAVEADVSVDGVTLRARWESPPARTEAAQETPAEPSETERKTAAERAKRATEETMYYSAD